MSSEPGRTDAAGVDRDDEADRERRSDAGGGADASRTVRASDAAGSAAEGEGRGTAASSPETGTEAGSGAPTRAEPEPEGFGRAGWVLVAAVFLSTLVIPGLIYLFPAAPAGLGFTFFATYLALPMIPAVLLGLVAVWSMTAATGRE